MHDDMSAATKGWTEAQSVLWLQSQGSCRLGVGQRCLQRWERLYIELKANLVVSLDRAEKNLMGSINRNIN